MTRAACISLGGTISNDSGGTLVTCTVADNVDPAYSFQTDPGTKSASTAGSDDFGCGISSKFDAGVCLTNAVYVFTVGLGGGLAYMGAFVFDTTVSLSLNSTAYALNFLSSGWTTARDLANMAFILILVYIAFMIMFEAETARTMQMLAWVIFIALIINFSFFFTRVVIDVGNILAVQFYNSVGVVNGQPAPTLAQTFGTAASSGSTLASGASSLTTYFGSGSTLANTKDLTYTIMSALNIQDLFSQAAFKAFIGGSSTFSKIIILSTLYIGIGAAYFILAAMFLAVGIKFLTRIVVLWFLIIASPLAFVCKAVPRKSVSMWYDRWQHELVQHAFYPAFFMFIFFFISTVMSGLGSNGGLLGGLATDLLSLSQNNNLNGMIYIASAMANVGIRLGFVVAMLYIALKASEYMGVKGATVAHGITNRVGGMARFTTGLPFRGIAAAGGALGRNTVGIGGNALARNTALRSLDKTWAAPLARGVRGAGSYLANSTFDVRNAPGGKSALSLGGTLTVGSGAKNGYLKSVEVSAKEKEKRARELEPTGQEKQNAEAKAKKQLGYDEVEKQRNEAQALVTISRNRTKKLEQEGKRNTPEWQDSMNMQRVDENRLAESEARVKEIKKQVDERAKTLSGEGLSKEFAQEALLSRVSVPGGNPGFVTRSSREAAAKILKGNTKTKEQEVIDAIKKLSEPEAAPAAAQPAPAPAPTPAAPPRQPLTRQALDKSRTIAPLPEVSDRIMSALENQHQKLKEDTTELKESNTRLEKGFAGLRNTVKEVLDKNSANKGAIKAAVTSSLATNIPKPEASGGEREVIERGRSGRPVSSAPLTPPRPVTPPPRPIPAPQPPAAHQTPPTPLTTAPIPPPQPPKDKESDTNH